MNAQFFLSFDIFPFFPSELIIGLDFVLGETRNSKEEIGCSPNPVSRIAGTSCYRFIININIGEHLMFLVGLLYKATLKTYIKCKQVQQESPPFSKDLLNGS